MKNENWRTYVILGDGELNEGSVWEAAMHAAQHKLGSLTIIIDYNRMQASGESEYIISLNSIKEKFISFGFDVCELNGHNIKELKNNLNKPVKNIGKPRVLGHREQHLKSYQCQCFCVQRIETKSLVAKFEFPW